MLKDLSVIIICYDPYKDAIELNPIFLDENWKNCSADCFYVSSFVDVDSKHKTIKTKGDLSYCGRLKAALDNTDSPYVMLLLDDYLIDKRVDENEISKILCYMEKNNIYFCELFTMFRTPAGKRLNKEYKIINKNRKYRITLQPSIFKKELLLELLEYQPKTAWDAELILNSSFFTKYDAFFCLNKAFSIINYIDKGEVTRKAYFFLKKKGLWKNQRPVMSISKTIKMGVVRRLSWFVPQRIKDKLKGNDTIYKG